MTDFSILDVLNYAQCGSRLEYKPNYKLFDSRELIAAHLVTNLMYYLFEKLEAGTCPSLDKMNKHLNILWSKIQKNISSNITPNDYIIIQSFAKRLLLHVSSYPKMEVIASNQIYDYPVGEDIIKIPLTLFRSGQDVYCYYIDPEVNSEEEPTGYTYLYNIIYKVGKELTKGFYYKLIPVIYRSQSLRLYSCKINDDVDSVLKVLLAGIKSEMFFPRTSTNCKTCRSKETCKFYNVTTN